MNLNIVRSRLSWGINEEWTKTQKTVIERREDENREMQSECVCVVDMTRCRERGRLVREFRFRSPLNNFEIANRPDN